MTTLIGTQVIFPKGGESSISLSKASPGPTPCPSGDIIAPFAAFPDPKPGTSRWYRLRVVYFDENAGGSYHVQVRFTSFSGNTITFDLPQCSSGGGASNFHYSSWYKSGTVNKDYFHITAYFVNNAVYNNSAGIYSIILEAHDIYQPGTSTDHSYTVALTNNSKITLTTHNGAYIGPGSTWTSEALGNGFVANPQLGMLSFYDLGTQHIDGDGTETFGVLISLRGYDYVARYNSGGALAVTINSLLQAQLSGMDAEPVALDAIVTQ